jgi:CMP-N-acetylneuraminic acid synthetase
MYSEILSVIPAKGNSKGLPNKNTYPFSDRPLLCWTIDASLQSQCVTRTIVSSDSDRILEVAAASGADTLKRPAELATDTATSESVLIHVLDHLLAAEGYRPDVLLLLQPTSPLRTSGDIDQIVNLYNQSRASAVISGYEPDHNPLKDFLVAPDGTLRAVLNDNHPFMPRQQLPRAFRPNGAIYLIKADLFLSTHRLLTDNTVPFYMDRRRSIDIDTLDDLLAAEAYMKSLVLHTG